MFDQYFLYIKQKKLLNYSSYIKFCLNLTSNNLDYSEKFLLYITIYNDMKRYNHGVSDT